MVQPATITELEQFHHVVTVTLGGQRTTPFKIRGLHVDDEYAEHFHPEWNDDVDTCLDQNLARRPIGEVLDELEDLDDRILAALQGNRPPPDPRPGRPPGRGSGAGVDLDPAASGPRPATPAGGQSPLGGGADIVPLRPRSGSPFQSTVE